MSKIQYFFVKSSCNYIKKIFSKTLINYYSESSSKPITLSRVSEGMRVYIRCKNSQTSNKGDNKILPLYYMILLCNAFVWILRKISFTYIRFIHARVCIIATIARVRDHVISSRSFGKSGRGRHGESGLEKANGRISVKGSSSSSWQIRIIWTTVSSFNRRKTIHIFSDDYKRLLL